MTDQEPTTTSRIFISYRRRDAAVAASWLFDRLTEHFGPGRVFMDVDSIAAGDEFVEAIAEAVGACAILLALIGDRWLTATDDRGEPRLENPADLVRLEIEAALTQGVRVIPVLVGAPMPGAASLPPSLVQLAYRQAFELSPGHLSSDISRLLTELDRSIGRAQPSAATAAASPAGAGPPSAPGPVVDVTAGEAPAVNGPDGQAQGPRRFRRRGALVLGVVAALLVAGGVAAAFSFRATPAVRSHLHPTTFVTFGSAPYTPLSVAFSPDGKLLAIGAQKGGNGPGRSYLWNMAGRVKNAILRDPHGVSANSIQFSPDGGTLAVGDGNGTTYLWNLTTRSVVARLADPRGEGVESVAYSPDGIVLAAGDYNGSTYLWDVAASKLIATLPEGGPRNQIDSVAFNPAGTMLAVGDNNGNTYLWDLTTRKTVATLTDPVAGPDVDAVAFSPDGTTLITSDDAGWIFLWDLATDKVIARLHDPNSTGADTIAFGPKGNLLAAGDANGSTYVWDLTTRAIVAALPDPGRRGVNAVAFSPDGSTLAAGDNDGKTYLWQLDIPGS
jgi:Tol biopolymer transport system component